MGIPNTEINRVLDKTSSLTGLSLAYNIFILWVVPDDQVKCIHVKFRCQILVYLPTVVTKVREFEGKEDMYILPGRQPKHCRVSDNLSAI